MTEEQIALARRAVACKGFRWMPGMRAEWIGMDTGWRILSESCSWYEREGCEDAIPGGPSSLPDLQDPATLGCLLALVREAWGDPRAHAAYDKGTEWDASHWDVLAGGFEWYCESEEVGLVAALEAAP